MKLLFPLLALVASSSAFIWKDEMVKPLRSLCIPLFGVAQVCADPNVSVGKREEDLNLAEIVADIGKVVHVIDGFVGGATAKREEQDLCEHIGCVIYCTQNDSIINHCKRDEALKLAEILTGIGKVIAGFVREAVTKREEQDLCTTAGCIKACDDGRFYNICKRDEQLNLADVVANIGKVIHVIDGFVSGAAAKREEQNLCIPINGVPFCGP
uniref:Uncharacterized protein n=1 Tax=Biomphalaria glabrata TaxID=6526 RepID=A0A2C9LQN3_BIOGL